MTGRLRERAHRRRRRRAERTLRAVHALTPEQHEELVDYLERDQLVADKSQHPVARAQLGRGAALGLWTLRIFALVVSAMVIYTFVASLAH